MWLGRRVFGWISVKLQNWQWGILPVREWNAQYYQVSRVSWQTRAFAVIALVLAFWVELDLVEHILNKSWFSIGMFSFFLFYTVIVIGYVKGKSRPSPTRLSDDEVLFNIPRWLWGCFTGPRLGLKSARPQYRWMAGYVLILVVWRIGVSRVPALAVGITWFTIGWIGQHPGELIRGATGVGFLVLIAWGVRRGIRRMRWRANAPYRHKLKGLRVIYEKMQSVSDHTRAAISNLRYSLQIAQEDAKAARAKLETTEKLLEEWKVRAQTSYEETRRVEEELRNVREAYAKQARSNEARRVKDLAIAAACLRPGLPLSARNTSRGYDTIVRALTRELGSEDAVKAELYEGIVALETEQTVPTPSSPTGVQA